MSNILNRVSARLYFPPCEPIVPILPKEPEKFIEEKGRIDYMGGGVFDLKTLLEKLPEGITSKDLRFESVYDSSMGDCDGIFWYVIRKPNKRYSSEMKSYQAAMKRYEKDMVKYNKDYEEWVKAKDEYDTQFTENEIKSCQARLKELQKKRDEAAQQLQDLKTKIGK